MSQQIINVGTSPNDGTGTPIRTAFQYTNNNFSQLFSLPNPTPPATLIGQAGDVPGMYAYSASYFYYCFGTYDGTTTIWAQIAQISNVTQLANGTSNVNIASANANVSIGVNGTPNVAIFNTAGVSVTGNVTTSGFFVGTLIGNTTGNFVVPGANTQVIYNFNGNAGASSGFTFNSGLSLLSVTGNIVYGNSSTNGTISSTGTIAGLNLTATGFISATGNIRGGNINSNGNVTATGNVYGNSIVGSYIYGDGSNLTNLPVLNYGNANVANYLPVFSGNISATNISATGLITTSGRFKLPGYTTLQIANLSATPGDMVFNTSLNKTQVYQANASNVITWVTLSSTT